MGERKRAPGGGRKPKGPIRDKRETFSTRITPATRKALDREAAESGQSVSQVAERLLLAGLEAKVRSRSMRDVRALSYLFERVALDAANARYERMPARVDVKVAHLRVDPFAYQAFKAAVAMLLDEFEPQGPAISPLLTRRPKGIKGPIRMTEYEWNSIGRFYETPQAYGAYICNRLLADLWSDEPSLVRQLLMMQPATADAASYELYGLQDARRDLGLADRAPEVE